MTQQPPDFTKLENGAWPAFVRFPSLKLPLSPVPSLNPVYGLQKLSDNKLIGVNSTVSSAYTEHLGLKRALKAVPRELERQLRDSKNAINPYADHADRVFDSRFYEFWYYGVFDKMVEICNAFAANIEATATPEAHFTAVSVSRGRISTAVANAARRNLDDVLERLKSSNVRVLPIKALNIQPADALQRSVEYRRDPMVQAWDLRCPTFHVDFDQTLSEIGRFAAYGVKLLVLDELEQHDREQEYQDVAAHTNAHQFVNQIRLVVQKGVVMYGGAACIKTRELSGVLFQQLLQFAGCFYEEVTVCKPFFSRFLNGERWVILRNKRKLEYDKLPMNHINATLISVSERLQQFVLPFDVDEDFEHIISLFDRKLNDFQLQKYLFEVNNAIIEVQNAMFKYQLIHFAFNSGDELQLLRLKDFKIDVELKKEEFKIGACYPNNQRRTRIKQKYSNLIIDIQDDSGTIEFILNAPSTNRKSLWSEKEIVIEKKEPLRVHLKSEQIKLEQIKEEKRKRDEQKALNEKKELNGQNKVEDLNNPVPAVIKREDGQQVAKKENQQKPPTQERQNRRMLKYFK